MSIQELVPKELFLLQVANIFIKYHPPPVNGEGPCSNSEWINIKGVFHQIA
ncbi:D-ribose transporter ATP-binding protein [Sesbania bispinosa]|nr:D-ribose transporter ATP-binding protein [Sesbania bispinosa]